MKISWNFWKNANRNIRVAVLQRIFSSISMNIIWFSVTFMVYALGGQNTNLGDLGFFATMFGLVSTLAAGYLSDRWRRDALVALGAFISLFGTIVLGFATDMWILFLGQFLFSIGSGMTFPVGGALVADSVKGSKMNETFGTLFLLSQLFGAVGNIVSYFIFSTNGGQLSLDTLLLTVRAGVVFSAITAVLTLFYVDPRYKSLEVSSNNNSASSNEPDNNGMVASDLELHESRTFKMSRYQYFMVIIILLSNYVLTIGAGISIPFIPRFFQTYYKLNLDDLSLVFALMMVLTGFWGKYMATLADKFGRIKMIVVNQGFATLLLFVLASYPPVYIAITTILVRNAAMNASGPVASALTYDNLSSEKRGIYSSANSVGWSILFGTGQAIGGRLIDSFGFSVAFLTTATLYLISTLMIAILRDESHEKRKIDVLQSNENKEEKP